MQKSKFFLYRLEHSGKLGRVDWVLRENTEHVDFKHRDENLKSVYSILVILSSEKHEIINLFVIVGP
jgi:hypothetical protein